MAEKKHTPTPWIASGRYIGTKNHLSAVGECRDVNGNWCDDVKSAADASFIVRAVNSHDKLVDALESLLSVGVEVFEMPEYGPVLKARAALASLDQESGQ